MKNTRFKALALLLSLALALTMLAGCSGGDTHSGNAGAGSPDDTSSNDTTPDDSDGDGGAAPAPEQGAPVLGREYAGEADPAAAILDKISQALESLPEGTLPEWDERSDEKDTRPGDTAAYTFRTYTLNGGTQFYLYLGWDSAEGRVTSVSMNVFRPGDDTMEKVYGAVFSDSIIDGLGELWAECSSDGSLVYAGGSRVFHAAEGYMVNGYDDGLTQGSILTYLGAELRHEGNVLYYTRDGRATVFCLAAGDGFPQNIVIPETLGGCPVTDVSLMCFEDGVEIYKTAVAVPATAETVDFSSALPLIYLLPENVRTIRCTQAYLMDLYAPMIMCTGRETGIDIGEDIDLEVQSNTGRKPTVQAYFGSELAMFALKRGWDVSYLDAIDGDRDAAREYLSGLLAEKLATLAAEDPEDAAELAENATFDELLDLVMENWDDAMEDGPAPTAEAREQLEKLKAGDYSVLEDAWQESHG